MPEPVSFSSEGHFIDKNVRLASGAEMPFGKSAVIPGQHLHVAGLHVDGQGELVGLGGLVTRIDLMVDASLQSIFLSVAGGVKLDPLGQEYRPSANSNGL